MANEFKVKKGLIVEGSGSTVLDIQGSQGQLFSVTDDLTGDIFSISDISGVPILNVNADGTTTIDGTLTLTTDETLDSTSDTSIKFLTRDSNGVVKYHTLGSNAFNSNTYNNYSLPLGTTSARGGFKIGYSESGKNYPVELSSEKMYVNVPWTDNNTVYTHPTHPGDDISVDTGALTGATVISDLDFNVTTDTAGHVTDANGSVGTRTLTLSDLGYDGATDANNFTYTHPTTAGNKHIPTGGSSGQFLKYSSSGTAVWASDNNTTYSVGDGGLTSNNFTDADHTKLNGITTSANNYSFPYTVSAAASNSTVVQRNGSGYIFASYFNGTGTFSTSGAGSGMGLFTGTNGTDTYGRSYTAAAARTLLNVANGATANTGTLTGNGTSTYIPFYSGTTSFSTTNKLTWDGTYLLCMGLKIAGGTLWSNGVTIISNTTSGTLNIGDTAEGDTIEQINFKTMGGTNIKLEDGETAIQSAVKLTSLSAQNSEATSLMINSSGFVGTRELGSNAFNSTSFTTNTGTLTGNGSTNRVPFYSGTTTLTTDNTFTYAASSDTLSVGKVSFGVGSATAPSVFFGGQSNTGLYWTYSPEALYVTVNGSTKAQWYSNGYKVVSGALGVNVNPSGTDGRIDASNDIVAYSSDKRLKENIKPIKNALDKVQSLSGFTYNWNEKAEEVAGFDRDESLVGVFAQDVQSILPEAVKPAPFDNDGENNSISGENYLTVQYDKLTPLLIESIKELKAEIEELKKCKCKCNKGEI